MKKPIDAEEVQRLARLGSTTREISAIVGCGRKRLEARFGKQMARWRAEGAAALRKCQDDKALEGNVQMMIWLGKQRLGQSERVTERAAEVPERFRVELDFGREPGGLKSAD